MLTETKDPLSVHTDSAILAADEIRLLTGLFEGLEFQPVRTTHSTHSETAKYQFRGSIVVKHTKGSTSEKVSESVLREFKALETAWSLTVQSFGACVPKALRVLPERGLLIVEELPGVRFCDVLRTNINVAMAPFRVRLVCATACKIGAWLSHFHQQTRQTPVAHDPVAFEKELIEQIDLCKQRGLSRTEGEELYRIANRGNQLIAGQELPMAARHGDFTPRNILVECERIGIIDFENFVECDTIYEDLGKFVAFLALLKGRPGYSCKSIAAVSDSFLEGYSPRARTTLVNLFALKAAVRIFGHRGLGRAAILPWVDNLYRRELMRFGREVDRGFDEPKA